jgi:hypothetical protein
LLAVTPCDLGKTKEFVSALFFNPKGGHERSHLNLVGAPLHDKLHRVLGLGEGQIAHCSLSIADNLEKMLHGCIASVKFIERF